MKNINKYLFAALLMFAVFTGCQDEEELIKNALPEASFTFAPEPPLKGEPVSFSDTSIDSDGKIVVGCGILKTVLYQKSKTQLIFLVLQQFIK
jgi:hypothetical protein